MENSIKESYTIRLSLSDREQLDFILKEKEIAYQENWSGVQLFRTILEIAYDKSKPKQVAPPELIEKIAFLENENKNICAINETNQEQYAALQLAYQKLVEEYQEAQKLVTGAMVLNFVEEDKQKIIDLFDYCRFKDGLQTLEEMFCLQLNILQRGGFFVLDETDRKFLEDKRNENK